MKEALVGVLGGIFWGLVCIISPNKRSSNVVMFRTAILMLGGCLALFGSKHESIKLEGSGALAVLIMAFVAGVGWRKFSRWEQDNPVTDILAKLWIIFQPILFVLIGTEIKVKCDTLYNCNSVACNDRSYYHVTGVLLLAQPPTQFTGSLPPPPTP